MGIIDSECELMMMIIICNYVDFASISTLLNPKFEFFFKLFALAKISWSLKPWSTSETFWDIVVVTLSWTFRSCSWSGSSKIKS